jgi:hypothetical protein
MGVVAVVLALIYLSRQIAMSNRLAQAEAWRSSIVGRLLFESPFFRTKWAGLRNALGQPFVEWAERTHHLSPPAGGGEGESTEAAS